MADLDVAHTMVSLARDKATGILVVESGAKRTEIEWSGGHPVFATETQGEPLGRLLVRQRLLTPDQYEQTLHRIADHIEAGKAARFGEGVVELGFLTSEQVQQALIDQLRWRVVQCMQLEAAVSHFEPSVDAESASFPFELDPLVLLATRWIDPARLDRFLASHVSGPPRLAIPGDRARRIFALEPAEAEFAASLDGSRSVDVLLEASGGKVDVRALLTAFLLTAAASAEAVLDPSDQADPASLPTPPVGEPAHDGASGPRPARYKLARPTTPLIAIPSMPPPANVLTRMAQSRPPMLRATPLATTAQQAPAVAASLTHPTPPPRAKVKIRLPDDPSEAPAGAPPVLIPAPPPSPDARISSERAFQAGKKLLHADDLEAAHAEFRRAAALLDGLPEYQLYVQWLEWLRGRTDGQQVSALRSTARAAVVQDANLAFPRYVLGRLALAEGDLKHAKPLFRFATKLDPTLLDAQRYTRLIELREREGPDAADAAFKADATAPRIATLTPRALDVQPKPPSSPPQQGPSPPAPAGPSPVPHSRRATRLMVVTIVVIVVAGPAAYFTLRPRASPQPAPPSLGSAALAASAVAPLRRSPPPSSPGTSASAPAASTTPSAAPIAGPLPSVASTTASPRPDSSGDLVVPASGGAHRVWIDGKLAGESPLKLRAACGLHTVQVGSHGATQTVEVTCAR